MNRSTAGALSVSIGGPPTYEWTQGFEVQFNGNQDFYTMIDFSNSGFQAGAQLPIDIMPNTSNWTMQFDVLISSNQVKFYWYIIAAHKQHDINNNSQSQAFILMEHPSYGWSLGSDNSGGSGWIPDPSSLPRDQYMTMTFVLDGNNFTLHVDGLQKAQLPSSYITLGTIGDEGVRLGTTRDIPSRMVGKFKNFKIYDYALNVA